ncbi:MAG: hypothetical protein FWF26_05380, partial [Treponema sp.]|nr:hypothetical protein [Treponema sp.]
VLLDDGQEICYADTGLPSDFSRNYIGPERGTFKAVSLSASASTMFVINDAGEMYTRLADFDTIGGDSMGYQYTYIPYKSNLSGIKFSSNIHSKWGLPSEDWRLQPRIPLAGKAAITSHITILQNGHGNGARELRVAGLNEKGETGYWYKQIFGDEWQFRAVPLYFTENAILVTADTFNATAQGKRGSSLDKSYSGYSWKGNEKENGWEYQIPNFNILEGDCDLNIIRQGETCTLKLHPVEMWSYVNRNYLPGRTGSPKMFFGTLEIPEHAFESLDSAFAAELKDKFEKKDRALFQYTIAASGNFIIMRDIDSNGSFLFLTDGTISDRYSDFFPTQYVENFEEIQRYQSPELTLNGNTALTTDEINKKIALNNLFINDLKYQIRVLKWSRLTAFEFKAGYMPGYYFSKVTPLRFIPKIKIATNYGDKIILANSAYIKTISDIRIWLYEKIITMLETRIMCYTDMLKNVSTVNSGATETNDVTIPPWYSENITSYWDIANLPHRISGTFFSPGIGNQFVKMPAVISFVPPPSRPGCDISGWFFKIGESGNFAFFIDPLNSAKMIYSRKGKTPQEQKLQLNCTLYVNEKANAPEEEDVIKKCLRPYIPGVSKGIDVRITCDGKTFEIREPPRKYSGALIFRGTLSND